jgi:Na+-transporting methylmalonyl-CoA/oxaloacetate decarboxylase beta subunit
MALEQLIARGGELMLIGMGVVFAFLTLLVLTVHMVSLAIRRLEARVVNKVGLEADHHNFLLMHAMGPNVAGVIGSAVAAGVLLALVP